MISTLSIIALGFFLGMRHATDPDHVIAVSTIVSRHRSVKHAAIIGGLWGVGHTLTILIVGSGIILFGWVIPARIGLSMEFSVGLVLISRHPESDWDSALDHDKLFAVAVQGFGRPFIAHAQPRRRHPHARQPTVPNCCPGSDHA